MPTVTELQLFAVDLPFKTAFRHAAAARTTSESLFLRVSLDSGASGWGESLPARLRLRRAPRGRLRPASRRHPAGPGSGGRSSRSPRSSRSWRSATARPRPSGSAPTIPQTSAWCSVDLALLDAFGRAFGQPASLGGQPPAADALQPVPLQRRRVRRTRLALREVAAQDARLRFPAGQAQARARTAPGQAARTARRLLGRRVDLRVDANMAWGVEQALEVIEELRAVGIQSFEQPIAAGDLSGLARLVRGVVGRDRRRRGPDRPRVPADAHQPSGLHGRERAHLQVRRPHRRLRAVPGGARRRPHAPGRLPGRRVVAAVGGAPDAAPALAPLTPGVRYAEGCFGRHLLREDPVIAAGPVRLRRPSSAAARRGRPGRPGRPGDARAMGGRPGRRRVGTPKGATDVMCGKPAALGDGRARS